MAPLSVEEDHYIRLVLLLFGLCPIAVRSFFDKEFPPTHLTSMINKNCNTLCDLKSRNTLSQIQWNKLFPRKGEQPNSNNFDVTLMICLIRNLTSDASPLYGFDSLPKQCETTPESDLARIKYYRNILAHQESGTCTIEDADFNKTWEYIADAVGRLGGQRIKYECQELKSKILDRSIQELLIESRQSQAEINDLRHNLKSLGLKHGELEEVVVQLRGSYNKFKRGCFKRKEEEKVTIPKTIRNCINSAQIDRTSSTKSDSSTEKERINQASSSPVDQCFPSTSTENVSGVAIGNPRFRSSTPNPAFVPDIGDSVYYDNKHSSTNILPTEQSTGDPESQFQCIGTTSTENVTGVAIRNPGFRSGTPNPVFVPDIGDSVYYYNNHSSSNILPTEQRTEDPEHQCQCIGTKLKKTIIVIAVCLSIVGALVFSVQYKHILGGLDIFNDPENTNVLLTQDTCEKDVPITLIGQRICIPYTQKFTGSGRDPLFIYVKQLSSKFLRALKVFSFNVSSATFVQQIGDWIVSFNSSRHNQQFRFVLEKATCDNVGKYEITIEYSGGNVTSFVIEIILEEPRLNLSVSRINESIHVHCEMTNNCKSVSLGLIVNDGDSSRVIPTMNDCNNPDRKSSSKIIAEAIIPASWFSGNQIISCVPLMTDPELAANLTSTMSIPACEGDSCEPNCKDDPHGIAYFQDKHLCNIFYQCSNGDIFLQECLDGTSWSHSECTCIHFNNEICDRKTYNFFKPAMSFEKCAKP